MKGGTCCVGVLLRERAVAPGKRNMSFDTIILVVGSSVNNPLRDVGTLVLRGDLWMPFGNVSSDMDRPLTVSNSHDSTWRFSDPERSLKLWNGELDHRGINFISLFLFRLFPRQRVCNTGSRSSGILPRLVLNDQVFQYRYGGLLGRLDPLILGQIIRGWSLRKCKGRYE